jgi:hypothetical protein
MTDAREVIEEYIRVWAPMTSPYHARDIIAALTAAGFAIVPKEPTPAMVRASTMMAPTWDDDVSRAKWRAMVEAASDE